MWPNPSRVLALMIALNQLAAALTVLPVAASGCAGAFTRRSMFGSLGKGDSESPLSAKLGRIDGQGASGAILE